jgi:hypothetical protein
MHKRKEIDGDVCAVRSDCTGWAIHTKVGFPHVLGKTRVYPDKFSGVNAKEASKKRCGLIFVILICRINF